MSSQFRILGVSITDPRLMKLRQWHLRSYEVGLALIPPAERARQTAEVAFPACEPTVLHQLSIVDSQPEEDRLAWQGFNSVRVMVERDNGWLHRWVLKAANAVRLAVRHSGEHRLARGICHVALIGHTPFVNLLGAYLVPEFADEILDLPLKDVWGFVPVEGVGLRRLVD